MHGKAPGVDFNSSDDIILAHLFLQLEALRSALRKASSPLSGNIAFRAVLDEPGRRTLKQNTNLN